MGAPIRWSTHPLRTGPPLRTGGLLSTIAVVSVAFTYAFASAATGILAGTLLIGAVSSYLLPTRYTIDDDGISISRIGTSRNVAWSAFKRADRHPDGYFLSPYPQPHRLDTFRGCFVRLPEIAEQGTIRAAMQNFLVDNAL